MFEDAHDLLMDQVGGRGGVGWGGGLRSGRPRQSNIQQQQRRGILVGRHVAGTVQLPGTGREGAAPRPAGCRPSLPWCVYRYVSGRPLINCWRRRRPALRPRVPYLSLAATVSALPARVQRPQVKAIHRPKGGDAQGAHDALVVNMRDDTVSNMIVMFLRLVTSCEVQRREDHFFPFITGMYDDPPATVDMFCQRYVQPMGEESDHIHIVAITDALQVLPIR